jgi:hypothetical protein
VSYPFFTPKSNRLVLPDIIYHIYHNITKKNGDEGDGGGKEIKE